MDYGTRHCLTCGKEFTATYPNHICCSSECQNARRRESWKRYGEKTRRKQKERLQNLIDENERLKKRVEELEKELEEMISMNNEEEGEEEEEENEAQQTQALPTMYVCERMKLKQMSPLPCGKRSQCHYPMPCKNLPKGMTKEDITLDKLPSRGSQLLPSSFV